MTEEITYAKFYTPAPYWGCPNCGANTYGAINPGSTDEEEYVYSCHGFHHQGMTYAPCGTKFKFPPQALLKLVENQWDDDEI